MFEEDKQRVSVRKKEDVVFKLQPDIVNPTGLMYIFIWEHKAESDGRMRSLVGGLTCKPPRLCHPYFIFPISSHTHHITIHLNSACK